MGSRRFGIWKCIVYESVFPPKVEKPPFDLNSAILKEPSQDIYSFLDQLHYPLCTTTVPTPQPASFRQYHSSHTLFPPPLPAPPSRRACCCFKE